MSDKNQAYCACLEVSYTPVEHEPGVMSERWTCNECGSQFVRAVAVDAARAEEREAIAHYAENFLTLIDIDVLLKATKADCMKLVLVRFAAAIRARRDAG